MHKGVGSLDKQAGHRNTNLELFRIISMILIIAHHYVVNSGLLECMEADPYAFKSSFFYLSGAWGKTGINCFVLITGYFMCKSHITLKKFLKLLLELEFYRVVIYLVFVLSGYCKFSVFHLIINIIIPIKSVDTGFTSAFLVFFLFIPFINILIHNTSEKMHIRLIILCLFLYTFLSTMPFFSVTMNYVSWFIVIYIISSYVRLYPKLIFQRTKLWGILSILSIIVSIFSILLGPLTGFGRYYLISDSNKAFALITAFCLFLFFKNVKISYSCIINTIASATFGVLLIHANSELMRMWLWKDTLQNTVAYQTEWCYLHFACSVIGIFMICTFIDLARQYLIERPLFIFYNRASPKLYSKLYSIEKKVLTKLNIKP